MKELQIHPYANIFPAFSTSDDDALSKSIAEHGQIHPIIIFEGKILDGRHRYKACRKAGVKTKWIVFSGTAEQALNFVATVNLDRRHLSESQRAMAAAKLAEARLNLSSRKDDSIANLQKPETQTEERKKAADEFNISHRSVETASKVLEEAPAKVVKKVETGEISLNAAANEVKAKEKAKEPVVDVFGKPIPDPLHKMWSRRGEILELMKGVASLMNKITEARKADDELFAGTEFSDAAVDLSQAHTHLRAAQYWCLCPYCQGRAREKCTFCKKRGFVSKDKYELVPTELRAINEKVKK